MTYVAVDGDCTLGFATVAPRHVDIEDLPERTRQKLPRYPIPVLGLARLAVEKSARSMGLGAQLTAAYARNGKESDGLQR